MIRRDVKERREDGQTAKVKMKRVYEISWGNEMGNTNPRQEDEAVGRG